MAVDLASSWCGTDLGPHRRSRSTYQRYPLDSLPSVADSLDGFKWLGDRGHPHAANIELLARLEVTLAAVGVTLPKDFVEFYSWDGWAGQLDTVSVTGCWTNLRPVPQFSPVEPGAFLLRFLSDQQDCVTWYLYLRRGEPAFVVHAFGLDFDYHDDDEHFAVIYRCAASFEEFAYRFWIENRIWKHLHDPDAGPPPARLVAYLAHLRQPAP